MQLVSLQSATKGIPRGIVLADCGTANLTTATIPNLDEIPLSDEFWS